MKAFYFLLLAIVFYNPLLGQKGDSAWKCTISGIAWDSTHNYALQSATVAIYRSKDSSLVGYQLSNVIGEFQFKDMPVGISLRMVISFTGYKTLIRVFTIPGATKRMDLKYLALKRSENVLEEVVVSAILPVRMNGDTLEFNPAAFKLDSNAVVEDLLRKLPGITIWGDGTITVNGKQVSNVLVDGKPFFGGDTRVATQNLPKTSIDKIQVYQRNKNQNNPFDSVTEINIRLKKDSKYGHFGKLAAGYGTRKYFEADGNLNIYSPKTQIGFVAAGNNINKVAGNVNTLLRNSTFKGVGANIDYQPDFRVQGINHPNAGGFIFQHDFAPPLWDRTNSLTANYFLGNNNIDAINNSQTITFLTGDSNITQKTYGASRTTSTDQRFNARYDRKRGRNSFYAVATLNSNISHYTDSRHDSVSNSLNEVQSVNEAANNDHHDSKNMEIGVGFNHRKDQADYSRMPGDYDINYTFNATGISDDKSDLARFYSMYNPAQNKTFDRKYLNNTDRSGHHIVAGLGNLSPWIFGGAGFHGMAIKLQNILDVRKNNENNKVKDFDRVNGYYRVNDYLTNISTYTVLNDLPLMNINKRIQKYLVNRYEKALTIDVNLQGQFYNMENASTHDFQDISRRYKKFVPNGSLNYDNQQYGDFHDNYILYYNSSSDYPDISQLAPLVDSTNPYFVQQGNIHLRSNYRQEISFQFTHTNLHARNMFNYNLKISAGSIQDNLSDSAIVDELGRTTRYFVNSNGCKYVNVTGGLNKAFKWGRNELQVQLDNTTGLARNPNYVNKVLNISRQFREEFVINLYYAFGDFVTVRSSQMVSVYRSRQSDPENGTRFQNSTASTLFSASVKCTKRFTLSSNITYNLNTSTGSDATRFTIWNANALYRLMKANNLEMKFSALDLLHQNKGIINYGSSNNVLTHGTVNVLQQYFMFTLSYFPRRFGKK